jgi:hypothetical protein
MSTAIEPEVLPPTELALQVPREITALVSAQSRFETDAEAFEVNSEASYQVADQVKESLKAEAKKIDEQRKMLTRPIDALKKTWMDWFAPAITSRTNAVVKYEMKMITYRRDRQLKAQEAQTVAEKLLQSQKEDQLRRAQKLEERAALLKTDSGKQKLYDEAERIKEATILMPDSIAIAPAEPQGVASDTRDNWKCEPKSGRMRDALVWLADHPEWWDMVDFKAAPSKRMAKQFHNAQDKAEPFKIWNDIGFATKRR